MTPVQPIQGGSSVAAAAIRDPKLNLRSQYSSFAFLTQAQEKLQLPRDMETNIELQKTIDYLSGKQETVIPQNPFTHPIDWQLVKTIHPNQQVLVRTERLDLTTQIAELRERAGGLPHPALEAAAVEHADYLVQLGRQSDLLRRQVLLVLREPLDGAVPTDGLGGPGPLAGQHRVQPQAEPQRRRHLRRLSPQLDRAVG